MQQQQKRTKPNSNVNSIDGRIFSTFQPMDKENERLNSSLFLASLWSGLVDIIVTLSLQVSIYLGLVNKKTRPRLRTK